jgi:putative Ca2+/H+ antiporter (TMEM165/GDT1 family)
VEAFLVSTAVVGLAEIGDKTQILSLMPHYGHLSPSYVAETVRAAFGSLGIVEPSNVAPIAVAR